MADVPETEEPAEAEKSGADMLSQSELDSLLAAATAETEETWPGMTADDIDGDSDDGPGSAAEPPLVNLPSFDSQSLLTISEGDESVGLSRVRDIPLEVTVELGRTRMLIRDILDLGAGSIIELDKLAGEPVDLFANGLLVARGEVVVIDDNFGVRVTEIITAAERQGGKGAQASAA